MRLYLATLGFVLIARVAGAAPGDDDLAKSEAAQRDCAAHDPHCDWLETFSSLEQASLRRALAARGYKIEPSPWGKVIAKIHVYNEPVFAEKNWLRFFNFIHYTTREGAIRDELTIQEGQTWSDDLVAESARRLRDPLYSSVVALVPVVSAEPGKVDLLVVTRDVWSLRFNTQYTFQQGSLTFLRVALSENNFLGNRDVAAAQFVIDQGSIAAGPVFIDKNVAGSHLYLSVSADERVTRQALRVFDPRTLDPRVSLPSGDPIGLEDGGVLHPEGSDSSISLSQPLWALASQWGWGVSIGHSYGISRNYLFTGLRGVHVTGSDGHEFMLPWEFERKSWSANANVVHQWGTALKQQLSFGESVSSVRPSLLPHFSLDPAVRTSFIRQTFPRSERLSAPFVEYSFFVPRYHTLRNVGTYDLAEDTRIGPDLDVSVYQGLRFLGSEAHFTTPSLSLGWTFPWCEDGFVRLSAGGTMRIQDDTLPDGRHVDTIDDSASAQIRAASPEYRYLRIIAQASISTLWNNSQNGYLSIGSDSGLRGYGIGQFIGQRRVSGIVEARSIPVPFWLLRVGAVAFYEAGGAANSLPELQIYQDVGFGVRALVPQTSRELFRFDIAFPLVSARDWPAGHLQFQAGFESYF